LVEDEILGDECNSRCTDIVAGRTLVSPEGYESGSSYSFLPPNGGMGHSSPVPFKALTGSLKVYDKVPLVVPEERVAYQMLFLLGVMSGTNQR